MNGEDLLKHLQKLTPKQLKEPIRLIVPNDMDMDNENIWLNEIEVSEKGQSGYEVSGEIRLIGNE